MVCDGGHQQQAAELIRQRRRQTNVRLDVREALLHLAARIPEDLQRRLGHLLVVHLQAAEQRLEGLGRVEGHRVREGEHLRWGRKEEVANDVAVGPTEQDLGASGCLASP